MALINALITANFDLGRKRQTHIFIIWLHFQRRCIIRIHYLKRHFRNGYRADDL